MKNIIDLYNEGKTVEEASAELNLPERKVRRIFEALKNNLFTI